MDYITYFKRLEYIKEMIAAGSLKSPNQIAKAFSCTEKTVRNMINKLREQGLEVYYCRKNKKYMFKV